jgi:hypothetical protein
MAVFVSRRNALRIVGLRAFAGKSVFGLRRTHRRRNCKQSAREQNPVFHNFSPELETRVRRSLACSDIDEHAPNVNFRV